ncbi:MAG: ABC-F family ATP-binding cassette domain-containing protein [Anaerolineaceae bacterium]|nr:MAG: ABC-F family ATP-binding cassette domain-containing protein [Anaerolineaceae bacterium]
MAQIIIESMSFYYKEFFESIFENVNLNLDSNWKLGLIGRNGRGKTTLLRLLHGELLPDRGKIIKSINTEFFPYPMDLNYSITMDVIKENIGGLRTLEENLEDLNCLQRYIDLDGFQMESRILKEMNLMNLPESLLDREYETLSGGEKTKVNLIILFLKINVFVLLDEPTNHLDMEGKRIVAEYLKGKRGFIVVSHDRLFLDTVCEHILSINKKSIEIEKGNFSTWLKNKELTEQYELRTKERLQKEIVSLEQRARTNRAWANTANKQKSEFAGHFRTNGSQAYMRQAKMSEKRIRDNIDEKKLLLRNFEKEKKLQLNQSDDISSSWLLIADHIKFGYTHNIIIEDFSLTIKQGDIIWLRGDNGKGKSTLLRLMSKRRNLDEEQEDINGAIMSGNIYHTQGLDIAFSYQEPHLIGGYARDYFDDSHAYWHELCLSFDLPKDFLSRPIETYSMGEIKKLEMARALSLQNHILFLDEPLNYMDIYFRKQLEAAIVLYKPTMVFVEHDEWFGEAVANRIIEL